MARPEKVMLIAVLGVLTVVAVSGCTAAVAQTEEELAAGFTERQSHRTNLYLPDGGTGVCQQFSVSGSDCHDPTGFPTACCLDILPPSTDPVGPYCVEYGPSLVAIAQVGHGFCCATNYPHTAPHAWYRFEDQAKPCDWCGGKTPGSNECCTRDRNVIPAYPVTDPSVCPDLMQDPDNPPSITTPPCGPESMEKKFIKIPQAIGPVIFEVACGFHDVCYSTCARGDRTAYKAGCDVKLGDDLSADCAAYWQPLIDTARSARNENLLINAEGGLSHCQNFARLFYLAVSDQLPVISNDRGGQDAFDKAQKKVCRCCKGGPDGEVLP